MVFGGQIGIIPDDMIKFSKFAHPTPTVASFPIPDSRFPTPDSRFPKLRTAIVFYYC
ncbi:hypothetical protein [Moorena sp. SIO4G3]|uniref:hypothetical protein n=1 Tax=Moorena sp. SIO4G3 TaxID=2607821 RepID=UPI0014298E8D|nr:hypothetical protein [Moorena sp. SIO4G3]NEO77715.1 hypothetical protein [Moorena sp. SIO4G3]